MADETDTKKQTAWHPLFVRLLRLCLPLDRVTIVPEYPLTQQPQRIDVVVIHLLPSAVHQPLLTPLVPSLGRHLVEHNLFELTGPTSSLGKNEFYFMRGYTAQYCADKSIYDRRRVRPFVVSSRLTPAYLELAVHYGASARELEPGLWLLSGLEHELIVVETERVGDALLHLFAASFLRRPEGLYQQMDAAQRDVFVKLYREVRQFEPRDRLRYSDLEELQMSAQEMMQALLEEMTPEERLRGLPPEERLRGLPPEERLRGLPPEERLAGLSDEEVLQLLRERKAKKPAGGLDPSSKGQAEGTR